MTTPTPMQNFIEKQLNVHNELLKAIKDNLPRLQELLYKISEPWCYEDFVYRYYHNSFKVYSARQSIKDAISLFKDIYNVPLNHDFLAICDPAVNPDGRNPRNIIEALLHAKYFLEMMVKYGELYDEAPEILDFGWASVLYLYNLR